MEYEILKKFNGNWVYINGHSEEQGENVVDLFRAVLLENCLNPWNI